MSYWIQTFTGRKVVPLALDPRDVDLTDIAHALAQKCRWTGHTSHFYSVAQHAVMVARAVADDASIDHDGTSWAGCQAYRNGIVLAALHHDSAEAYLPDIARPVKMALRDMGSDVLMHAERRALRSIAVALRFPFLPDDERIKRADGRMLATEARDLMHGTADWYWDPGQPYADEIHPWAAPRAESLFLAEHARWAS